MKNHILLSALVIGITTGFFGNAAFGQANTSLSNLAATTSVNSHLLPQTNNTKDLGSAFKSWLNIYLDGTLYIDDIPFLKTIGSGNSLIGAYAGNAITTGTYNTFTGENSGLYTATGYSNSFYGHNAGFVNSYGFLNTYVGKSTGYRNDGDGNTAVGASALMNNYFGDYNCAFGFNALAGNLFSGNGSNNVAVGANALLNCDDGWYNIAVGRDALTMLDYGSENIAIGAYALSSLTYAEGVTAIGYEALKMQTGPSSIITAVGNNAMGVSVSAGSCVAVGNSALFKTNGHHNTALGVWALDNDETGIGNTAIGARADVTLINLTNATVIGYDAVVDASNKVRIGNSSVTSNGGQVSWTAYSDGRIKSSIQENVPGLQFINQLRPVTYHFDLNKQNELLGLKDTTQWEGKYDIEKIQWTGFIAQEVESAANNIGYDFSGVDKSGEIMGLRYAEFVVPLVKSVQELSEQNSALQTANTNLETRIAKLEALLSATNSSTTKEENVHSVRILNESPSLNQNIPNPFTGKTNIHYFVPETAKQAKVVFATQGGIEVYTTTIQTGQGSLEIDASQLAPGNYVYSLVVDGILVASKQLVLVK
jgi:trimeric autotransporter adhesin